MVSSFQGRFVSTAVTIIILITTIQVKAATLIGNQSISTTNQESTGDALKHKLIDLIENVENATGYRYNAKDDRGNGLDALKIIENPTGGFLGVYHTSTATIFSVKLGKSDDLLTWKYIIDLDSHASQPTIKLLNDGSFLVAYEKDSQSNNWIRFRYYKDLSSLTQGNYLCEFDANTTLSPFAEGTPNIYSVILTPDIQHSQIELGFHFYQNGIIDRLAKGTLVNFSQWTTYTETVLNSKLNNLGIKGNIGDRDYARFEGYDYNLQEGQFARNDWSSWRIFLYSYAQDTFIQLKIKTHQGSIAFGNPTLTPIISPNHKPAIISFSRRGEIQRSWRIDLLPRI